MKAPSLVALGVSPCWIHAPQEEKGFPSPIASISCRELRLGMAFWVLCYSRLVLPSGGTYQQTVVFDGTEHTELFGSTFLWRHVIFALLRPTRKQRTKRHKSTICIYSPILISHDCRKRLSSLCSTQRIEWRWLLGCIVVQRSLGADVKSHPSVPLILDFVPQYLAWSLCALFWPTVYSWLLVTHPNGRRMWSK